MGKVEVSVVIPYYRGKKYIKRAVYSVLNQSFKNIEVILINDGSPDQNDFTCENLASSDARIRYYKKRNEGIGATRNFGIKQAIGKYLAFLDQDDIWCNGFLDTDMFRQIENGGDVVAFSHYCTNSNFMYGRKVCMKPKTIGGGYDAATSCWSHHSSMFFRREFLIRQNIKYALARHEDVIFLQRAWYLADKITFIDKTMFCYRNNPSSETHRQQSPEELYVPILMSWLNLLEWHELQHRTDKKIIRFTKNMICIYVMEAIEAMYQYGRTDREVLDVVNQEFPKSIFYDYDVVMFSEWRKEQWRDYFQNHSEFVRKQKRKRYKLYILQFAHRFSMIKRIYERKKYPEVIPLELYREL